MMFTDSLQAECRREKAELRDDAAGGESEP